MAVFSTTKPSYCYNDRSISLQPRSHPSMVRIQEEINKIRVLETSCTSNTAEICIKGLSCLSELYMCIEELLNLPSTQQCMSQECQNELWVNELLDCSVRYLDICSNMKDSISSMKENARELQSALRRSRTGDLSIEGNIDAFCSTRKKFKKHITTFLTTLKQMDKRVGTFSPLSLDDHHVSSMVRVLREASLITGSIFHSLLSYLSVPVLKKQKHSKWSLVSKLIHKGTVASEGQQVVHMNELESVDIELGNLIHQDLNTDYGMEKIQCAYERLEALDVSFESLESGLECMFRHLIRTRVSLLNAVSYQID